MGLYDERLADLSEPKNRVAARGSRHVTSVQSLLFSRDAGWTPSKAKAWAKAHGYKHGKVDVTDQYIRIRQFDPKGFKTKRTIPFGRGIRAVIAREGMKEMAKARRRKSRRSKKAPKRARRARRRRVKAATAVAAPRRRRRRRARAAAVSAPRRRRRRVMAAVAAPKRRRRRRARRARAWHGNPAGHRKAAKKGWARKRRTSRRRRARATEYVAAPRRRRRRMHASVAAPRRSRRRMYASRSGGMGMGETVVAIVSGTVEFVLADGLDRFMATYNPSSTEAKPTDKFTSDGAGTLANTLNIASRPGWKRAAVAAGAVAVPAAGAYFVKNRMAKAALEGLLVGTGINGLKLLVNNVVMPLLVGKDTSTPALQKSFIARLYPSEVAAKASMTQRPSTTGALSGPDVGPFALQDSPRYGSAEDALRRQAGVHGDSPYEDAQQAMRRQAGVHDMPSAADALRHRAGVSAPYMPGPPPGPGPGPTNSPEESCGCAAPSKYDAFLGDQPAEATPFN